MSFGNVKEHFTFVQYVQYLEDTYTKKLLFIWNTNLIGHPEFLFAQSCNPVYDTISESLVLCSEYTPAESRTTELMGKQLIKLKLELPSSEGNTLGKNTWEDPKLVKPAVYATLQLPLQTPLSPHPCWMVPDRTRVAGNPSILISKLILKEIRGSPSILPWLWEPHSHPNCTLWQLQEGGAAPATVPLQSTEGRKPGITSGIPVPTGGNNKEVVRLLFSYSRDAYLTLWSQWNEGWARTRRALGRLMYYYSAAVIPLLYETYIKAQIKTCRIQTLWLIVSEDFTSRRLW